jgi:hypothetical protein
MQRRWRAEATCGIFARSRRAGRKFRPKPNRRLLATQFNDINTEKEIFTQVSMVRLGAPGSMSIGMA